MLRSSGAAGRALQIRIKLKTAAALPNLYTSDRCYRLARPITSIDKGQSFVATSLDEGFCAMGDGNEACLGAPVWCGTNSGALATLTITDAHKGSSEVYGKIEGFTSPAV
jgi:hypothetical protein